MKRIIVVGGGPGGYVAAIRAAQLGAEVHIVEVEAMGGTCLNVGCIPTKALLHTAELYSQLQHGKSIGLKADKVSIDWPALQSRKHAVVNKLVKGVESLLKANKVIIHRGSAVLKDIKTVEISGTEPKLITADAIILAVGSEPVQIPFPGADLTGVIDSTGALSLPKVPESMVIIGGGVIGVEFADLYSSLGCKVTVVELLPEVLPAVDVEIAGLLKQQLAKRGVSFMTGAKLTAVRHSVSGLTASITVDNKTVEIGAEYVLVAVGRKPRTAKIGLEELGVKMERGKVMVDKNFSTNIPGLYAIGDCNGQIMLAHAASAQGIAAAEHIMGHAAAYFANTIPSCIYTSPEVAGVGLTEEQVKQNEMEYKFGKFSLGGNGKSIIENGGIGLIKIIAGKKYGEILGVHMIGPRVTDMIAEAALAIRLEATVDELISTIHAHPTVSEAVGEAALAVEEMAIHWPPRVQRN